MCNFFYTIIQLPFQSDASHGIAECNSESRTYLTISARCAETCEVTVPLRRSDGESLRGRFATRSQANMTWLQIEIVHGRETIIRGACQLRMMVYDKQPSEFGTKFQAIESDSNSDGDSERNGSRDCVQG